MTSATLSRFRQSTTDKANSVRADTRPVALFLYTRISKDAEGTELGVQRQADDLDAWAQRDHPNATTHGGYCDNDRGASTRSKKPRPRYERLLRDVRDAATSGQYSRVIVAAYTSSRLTRRPREHEDLIDLAEQYGVEYYFLRSPSFDLNTAAGRVIARMLASMDAGEAETAAERILRAKTEQAVNGIYTGGGRPFGYQVERDYAPSGLPIPGSQRLVIDEREADAIRKAVKAFLAGTSLRAIARGWNASGLATDKGNQWRPSGVRNTISRWRIAGLSERQGVVVGKGQWEPIISEDELAAVRAKLGDPSRKSHHGSYERKWLGGSMYLCGQPKCESKMRSAGGNRGTAPRYWCIESGHCAMDAATVDNFVLGHVASLFALHNVSELAGNRTDEADRLDHEINVARGTIAELDQAYDGGDGELSLRAYTVQTSKLEDKLTALEAARAQLVIPETVLTGVDSAEDFLNLPIDRQRAIVDLLVTVTILPGKRGRQLPGYKITERVKIVPKK